MALVVIVGVSLFAAGIGLARPTGGGSAEARSTSLSADLAARPCAAPSVTRPPWLNGKKATLLVDSVLLGGVHAIRSNLSGWKVLQLGRPAVMIHVLEQEIRAARTRIAPLAIVGVGYNSLWQRNRRNYANWAREFDRQAGALVRTLRRQGAKQIVWVTLREARRGVIPATSLWQQDRYGWYFPYVNERLRKLDRRRRDLVLADWAKVSNRPGLTYDAIHLDPDGQRLMARTVRRSFEREAVRQVASARTRGERACSGRD